MIFRRELGEKGQVVIPADIRKLLGVRNGEEIVFEIKENNVFLKSSQDPDEFLNDFFNIPKLDKLISMKDIKKTILEREKHVKIS